MEAEYPQLPIPQFNLIPATPIVDADEFGAKRVSFPPPRDAAIPEAEEFELPVLEGHIDSAPTSSTSQSHSISSHSTSSSFSSIDLPSLASVSSLSTLDSFPDVEQALGSMLASLGAMDIDPMRIEKQQVDEELASWASLGRELESSNWAEYEDRAATPTPVIKDDTEYGLGFGLASRNSYQSYAPSEETGCPIEYQSTEPARIPIVNHKTAFYSGKRMAHSDRAKDTAYYHEEEDGDDESVMSDDDMDDLESAAIEGVTGKAMGWRFATTRRVDWELEDTVEIGWAL